LAVLSTYWKRIFASQLRGMGRRVGTIVHLTLTQFGTQLDASLPDASPDPSFVADCSGLRM
jgi:hypothetical protein